MSLLEKIVLTADYIEPNRDRADNLAEMRYLAFQDPDFCAYRITADTLRYLASKQICADQKTEECYRWLKEVKKYDGKRVHCLRSHRNGRQEGYRNFGD